MAIVGRKDVFEREYTQRFRRLLGAHGEFVLYERDRGVRDIGVHLTEPRGDGSERVTTALCWFQLKGKMQGTLTRADFDSQDEIEIRLDTADLRYWYMQPVPTYLALYIAAADQFLVLNLQSYVEKTWGREVMKLKRKSAVVKVPKQSILDYQALALILRESNQAAWAKALGTPSNDMKYCVRDWALITQMDAASKQALPVRLELKDWQTKMRGEVYFWLEPKSPTEPLAPDFERWDGEKSRGRRLLRSHWQVGLSGDDLEIAYPYLEFFAVDRGKDEDDWDDDDDYKPVIQFSNDERVMGANAADQYHWFYVGVRLNRLGTRLARFIAELRAMRLIEDTPPGSEFISIAPWHHRSV